MPDEEKLSEVIHFKVTPAQKEDLETLAKDMEISVGELCRQAIGTVGILFDDNLRFCDVLKNIGELRQIIDARHAEELEEKA